MPRQPAADPDTRTARTVRCPACSGPSLYGPANPWRPFCSQRCKLQDLGDWASERFRVEARAPEGTDDANLPQAGTDSATPWVH